MVNAVDTLTLFSVTCHNIICLCHIWVTFFATMSWHFVSKMTYNVSSGTLNPSLATWAGVLPLPW